MAALIPGHSNFTGVASALAPAQAGSSCAIVAPAGVGLDGGRGVIAGVAVAVGGGRVGVGTGPQAAKAEVMRMVARMIGFKEFLTDDVIDFAQVLRTRAKWTRLNGKTCRAASPVARRGRDWMMSVRFCRIGTRDRSRLGDPSEKRHPMSLQATPPRHLRAN